MPTRLTALTLQLIIDIDYKDGEGEARQLTIAKPLHIAHVCLMRIATLIEQCTCWAAATQLPEYDASTAKRAIPDDLGREGVVCACSLSDADCFAGYVSGFCPADSCSDGVRLLQACDSDVVERAELPPKVDP